MIYILAGNSYASVWAAESIRKVDADGEIIIISAEPYKAYAKALLQDYISGRFREDQFFLRGDDFYEKLKAKIVFSDPVVEVNREKKMVLLKSGTRFSYDFLFLSTGGKPIIPEVKGLMDCRDVLTFTTLDDAKRLKEKVDREEVENVVVVGGGLIGTQCADGLARRGVNVTIVELERQILPRAVDELMGEWIEMEFIKRNIKVVKNNTVVKINSRDGKIKSVKLKNGDEMECDLLIFAIGVRPNVDFLKGSGIDVKRGIVVDENLRTNDESIFAGGDVAEALEILSGEKQVIPIIPIAAEHGKIAGFNMAGKRRKFTGGLSQNSFHFGDLEIISAGLIQEGEGIQVLKYLKEEKKIYKKMLLKNGYLIGFILCGQIENAGIFTALIKNRIPVKEFADSLLEPSFHLHCLPRNLRREILEKPA